MTYKGAFNVLRDIKGVLRHGYEKVAFVEEMWCSKLTTDNLSIKTSLSRSPSQIAGSS